MRWVKLSENAWRPWFAWYPVCVWAPLSGAREYAWLERVVRRRFIGCNSTGWEYRLEEPRPFSANS